MSGYVPAASQLSVGGRLRGRCEGSDTTTVKKPSEPTFTPWSARHATYRVVGKSLEQIDQYRTWPEGIRLAPAVSGNVGARARKATRSPALRHTSRLRYTLSKFAKKTLPWLTVSGPTAVGEGREREMPHAGAADEDTPLS